MCVPLIIQRGSAIRMLLGSLHKVALNYDVRIQTIKGGTQVLCVGRVCVGDTHVWCGVL